MPAPLDPSRQFRPPAYQPPDRPVTPAVLKAFKRRVRRARVRSFINWVGIVLSALIFAALFVGWKQKFLPLRWLTK